jgi:hypothetical protein
MNLYEQDNNASTEKKPIEWIVLEKDEKENGLMRTPLLKGSPKTPANSQRFEANFRLRGTDFP